MPTIDLDTLTRNEATMWFAIFILAMETDRMCPMCREEQPRGQIKWKILYQHLKAEHREIYDLVFEGSKEQ